MIDIEKINFNKLEGLVPAVVQDEFSKEVLMVGFMNELALRQTVETSYVTFFSRTRQKLWMKGETSGNYLKVKNIKMDCDQDSLLIVAEPKGPTCHTGDNSCFGQNGRPPGYWLEKLYNIIGDRKANPTKESYTTRLFNEGISRIAQKVGEEGVEVALAALAPDPAALTGEAVDLLYHLFVLLQARDISLEEVIKIIQERNKE